MVAWFPPFLTSVWWHIGKYEIKNIFSKSFKSLYFWLGIWVQGPYFDGKNTPHSLSMFITTSELCGFGIGFGIGRKYRPITVSVSVSGLNQNSGFSRSLSFGRSHSMSRSRPSSKVNTTYYKNSNSSCYNAGKTYLDDWCSWMAILSLLVLGQYRKIKLGVVVFAKVQGLVNLKVKGPKESSDFETLHVRGPL